MKLDDLKARLRALAYNHTAPGDIGCNTFAEAAAAITDLEALVGELGEALRAADRLSLHAQTSGGTSGPDAGLIEAIDKYADARTAALGAKLEIDP